MADFYVGQGDTASALADTLKNADGSAEDIAGATVRVTIRNASTGAIIVNNALATNLQVGNGSDGSKGKVSYSWAAGQTDTAGTYLVVWTVTYSGGAIKSFPNGGYLLLEITADAPISTANLLATSTDLGRRLGIELTADEHVRASYLLALASGLIQRETRQKIVKVTGETLTVPGSYSTRYRLPERPIVSITSVTLDGKALVSGTDWYLDGDELVRKGGTQGSFEIPWAGGWGKPSVNLVVVYTHGYDPIPEAVKAVCLDVVARVWVNPGMAKSQTIGSESAAYAAAGLVLTEAERRAVVKAVGRSAGSVKLR